ncbi:MAG: cyclic nucleotide-binding domain-containing protein [Sulfuricellaceae bacterium]|nr:cyclic nucleotide-binding domain-containing protein [Sulfuricellaceae bacterium]
MTIEHFSPEQKILRVMRKVLGSVVKDVTPQDGMDNPLNEQTIEEIRDIFGLISMREKELLAELGQRSSDRPHYPGDKPAAKVIPINAASLNASRKKAESDHPLAKAALFKDADMKALDELLDECAMHELKEGETLLAAGESNQTLFIVMAGSLKAELDASRCMNFTAGQCIGEISALGESTMSAPVVANEASLLMAIAPDALWSLIGRDAIIARNILAMLAHR